MRYPLLRTLIKPTATAERSGLEPFAAALKRYIAAGYKAPDAMRATWHDVRVGRVARPARPGRRYRQAVAGMPGRPLYHNRRRNPIAEAFDLGSRREWEQAIRDVGGLKVAKQDRADYVDVPGYLQGYKRGMAPDELVQQVSDATGVPPRDVERAMFRAFKGRRRAAAREEDFDVEAWKAAGPKRRAARGVESRPRVTVMRDTFGIRPRSPFKGVIHYAANPGRRYVAGGDIFRSTISAREAGRLVRASGASRLPRIGWCTRLNDGREVCHDVSGYYLVGTARRNPRSFEAPGFHVNVTTVDDFHAQGLPYVARDLKSRGFAGSLIVKSPHSIAAFQAFYTARGGLAYIAGSRNLFDRFKPLWSREHRAWLKNPRRRKARPHMRGTRRRNPWSTFAGGTAAAAGKHAYGNRGAWGYYSISPMSSQSGRHIGYSLKWANEKGLPVGRGVPHSGLWHDLGLWRHPAAAKSRAKWHASLLGFRLNPFIERKSAAAFLRGLPRGARLTKLNPRKRRRAKPDDLPPYGEHTGIKHHMLSEPYWQAMQRADYYRWSASRGFVGRDPLTGREERTPAHRAAATACDKAQARVWLDQAAKLRGSMGRQVLPRNPRTARFCPETIQPKGRFDPRSFRTVVSRGHRVTVACPRGRYAAHGGGHCRHALEAQRILHPAGEGRCPYGGPRQRARRNPPRRAKLSTFYDHIDEVRGRKGRKSRSRRPGHYRHRFSSGPRARGVDRGGLVPVRRGDVVMSGPRPIYRKLSDGGR